MNLQQVQALKDLYPPVRTRSGKEIQTTVVDFALANDGIGVVVKTIFPPPARRSELLVTTELGELRIRPVDASAMADAQRFAELLRGRWMQEQPELAMAPLRLAKDDEGRWFFFVAPTPAPAPAAAPTPTNDNGGR